MFAQTQSWSFLLLLFKMNAEIVECLEVLRGVKVELEFTEGRQRHTSSPPPPNQVSTTEKKIF